MAMTAAVSLAFAPRRIRRRDSQRDIAPIRPKAVSAIPTIMDPVSPKRKGREARRAISAPPEIHVPFTVDEAPSAEAAPIPIAGLGFHWGPAPIGTPATPACG